MSYTELFKFNKNGKPELLTEIKNSWHGAMKIWRIIEKKYLPSLPAPSFSFLLDEKPDYWSRTAIPHFDVNKPNPMEEIWSLLYTDKLTFNEKIVLGSTFDNVIIKKENFEKTIKAFEIFDETTSLKEQAEAIKTIINDNNIIAIGFNQTSVNADNWENYYYNEETEETSPYNLLKNNKHWYLFENITTK